MPIIKENLAKTTAWHNNCAFNCVAGFLADELDNFSAKELDVLYANNPSYQKLLKEFSHYYQIEITRGSELQALLQQYPNSIDRESILGPVLRKRTSMILLEKKELAEKAFSTFAMDVKMFLKPIKTKDYINKTWMDANQVYLSKLQEGLLQYDTKELEQYWSSTGYPNYTKRLGDQKIGDTVTNEELAPLTEDLQIGLQVYTDFGQAGPIFSNTPEGVAESRWLTVFNGGRHWERAVKSAEIANQHNVTYDMLDAAWREIESVIKEAEVNAIILRLKVRLDGLSKKLKFWQVGIPNGFPEKDILEDVRVTFLGLQKAKVGEKKEDVGVPKTKVGEKKEDVGVPKAVEKKVDATKAGSAIPSHTPAVPPARGPIRGQARKR